MDAPEAEPGGGPAPETAAPRTPRRRARRLARLLGLMLLVAVALAGAGYVVGLEMLEPWRGATGPVPVTIPRGASARDAGAILERAGVVRHRLLVPVLARWRGSVIKAGDYTFEGHLSPEQVLRLLEKGTPPPFVRVTVPEGLRIDQVAEVVANAGLGTCDELMALAADPSPIIDLDPEAGDLEGYLHPDTYHLRAPATVADLVRTMLTRFREVREGLARDAPAALSVRRWVTLASLVEEETAVPDERPRVASVYWNRLQLGMLLQCDPTIIYAFVAAGLPAREPMVADLAFPSPYNSYLNPGLPPGPISSPGPSALAAAWTPQATDELYFVARGDGGHVFSRTLDEHHRAVSAWRRVQAERRRAERAGAGG